METPDANAGKEWSVMDIIDLRQCVKTGSSAEETAHFFAPLHRRGPRQSRGAGAFVLRGKMIRRAVADQKTNLPPTRTSTTARM